MCGIVGGRGRVGFGDDGARTMGTLADGIRAVLDVVEQSLSGA